jgi:hypothetical protein
VRWAEELSGYNFMIKFRTGKESSKVDALSRRSQDMPRDVLDERITKRHFQLIKERWLAPEMTPEIQLYPIHT